MHRAHRSAECSDASSAEGAACGDEEVVCGDRPRVKEVVRLLSMGEHAASLKE
jgi:hypothetical protein